VSVNKLGDLSFIDDDPNSIYIIDISDVLASLPVYMKNLVHKLDVYKNKYNLNYKRYKNWIIFGDVKFSFPELKIIR
jgi:hypothetical protein